MSDLERTGLVNFDSPDWADHALEARCPLCDYNLRGLIDPRCPECGYQFAWRDLFDPKRRSHPYLFELYRGSRFASFWKTAFHGLRPKKFWNTLRADQRIVPGRLAVYAVIVVAICVCAAASMYVTRNLGVFLEIRSIRKHYPNLPRNWVFPVYSRLGFDSCDRIIVQCILAIGWPILTLLSLMIFQVSMRRAKVKPMHPVRCVIYSWDIIIWTALATLIGQVICSVIVFRDRMRVSGFRAITFPGWGMERYGGILLWAWLATILIFQYRLVIAYWYYLRFRQVIATIFASQLIVFLAMSGLLYHVMTWFHLEY